MPQYNIGGKIVNVPEDVVDAIMANARPSKGSKMGVDELSKKYPWAAEYLAKNGLSFKDNGKGGFKQIARVQCQAGKDKVLTTSKFRGIDSVIPEKMGPYKVAKLVTYNFSALTIDPQTKQPTGCDEEFDVATSDLFQTFLCTTHRAENKAHAEHMRKVIRNKETQAIIEEGDSEAPEELSDEDLAADIEATLGEQPDIVIPDESD
jgi:hypothetical protein